MSKNRTDQKLLDAIRSLPGYDPFVLAGDCTFDPEEARRRIKFIETHCRHMKGPLAKKRMVLAPWQVGVVGNLFGWVRPDGTRRYRSCLIFVPRKNGKSTLAAAIALTMLYTDGEHGAEIYSAAAKREQAEAVFHPAKFMVNSDKVLSRHAQVYRDSIVIPESASFYKSLAKALQSQAGSQHGMNVHCAVVDELHGHPTRDLVDAIETATDTRTQPLVVHLTTADYDREGSICNEKYDYACRVRDNPGDPERPGYDASFLPVIYEATRDDDWSDPAVWRKANPSLGVTFTEEKFREAWRQAKDIANVENTFKRLRLNIRTEQAERIIRMEMWDKCAWPVNFDDLPGPCCCGFDLGTSDDFTAYCAAKTKGDNYYFRWWFWVPSETAKSREHRDGVPYSRWARDGWITLTSGNETDMERVRQDIGKINEKLQPVAVNMDRSFQGVKISQELTGDGWNMVPMGQGLVSMTGPTSEFLRLVHAGLARHGDNPVARWMATNTVAERGDSDSIKVTKRKSSEKVDGIVAAIMALAALQVTPEKKPNKYDTEELFVA